MNFPAILAQRSFLFGNDSPLTVEATRKEKGTSRLEG
jgi:hypothetical protein